MTFKLVYYFVKGIKRQWDKGDGKSRFLSIPKIELGKPGELTREGNVKRVGRKKRKERKKKTSRLRAKDDENDVSSAWSIGTCKCSLPTALPLNLTGIFPVQFGPIVFTFAVFPHLIFTKGASHITAASLIKAL